MKRIIISLASLLLAVVVSAQDGEALKVKTYTLRNGMEVWVNEDPYQAAVYGAVVVKAGAADCPETGIAHYFEHMMFKGTEKIGTVDFKAEKPYLDSIEVLYDRLALTSDDSTRNVIQMEINRLSIKAADYVIPNEFDNLIAEMGGSGLNAFTAYDQTVYHNKFLPEYLAQWAELNSERLIDPVFRLFQSELETVYEEKNRSDDNLINDFREKMIASVYEGTPYAAPVIGTTDNLKNPNLARMKDFFNKYYVASNMVLILSGNVKAEKCLPVLERTFGRIRNAEVPEREPFVLEQISGQKDVMAKVNMPFVKIGAICYRTPTKSEKDYLATELLVSMLNNENGTGILDKLMVDHKVMMVQATSDLTLKDAGSLIILYMPKLLFQSDSKALSIIDEALEPLRKGEISDEFFESSKLSYKKTVLETVESQEDRIMEMIFAASENRKWEDVLANMDRIDAITKEEIAAVAVKYLGKDRIVVHKEKGMAVRDKLEKPGYEKVVPKNKEVSSQYAQALRRSAASVQVQPGFVDFEKDVRTVQVAPLVKLYATENPYNDIFNITFSYGIGNSEIPDLDRVCAYVNLLGTDTQTFDEINGKLQSIGSAAAFWATDNEFRLNVTGFDDRLEETLAIVSDRIANIKGDKKKLRKNRSEEKAGIIMNRRDMDELTSALRDYVIYGENSSYVRKKGEYTDVNLLRIFRDVLKVECDVTYSGTLDAEKVASVVKGAFDVNAITVASNAPIDFAPVEYDSSRVFFVDKKDASQSQIWGIYKCKPAETASDRNMFRNYCVYLGGGGMSNLMFQEIREFRSMAYTAYATLNRPYFKNFKDYPMSVMTYVGTQFDKTDEAMRISDSLVVSTPFLQNRVDNTRNEMLNGVCGAYPDFRSRPGYVSSNLRNGHTQDPSITFVASIKNMTPQTLEAVWKKYVAPSKPVWCVVGNSRKLDMGVLESRGPVTVVKSSEIIR